MRNLLIMAVIFNLLLNLLLPTASAAISDCEHQQSRHLFCNHTKQDNHNCCDEINAQADACADCNCQLHLSSLPPVSQVEKIQTEPAVAILMAGTAPSFYNHQSQSIYRPPIFIL